MSTYPIAEFIQDIPFANTRIAGVDKIRVRKAKSDEKEQPPDSRESRVAFGKVPLFLDVASELGSW